LTPKEKYSELAKKLLKLRGVSIPKDRKGFGSSALWAGGKMFAFLSSKNELILKLPKERVDALVASGNGARCDLGRGPMKEWIALNEKSNWLDTAKESMKFVSRGHGS
jgi:TfoX/Sxy family transcriptional regulator of competence genes